jgi:hypothetical protein
MAINNTSWTAEDNERLKELVGKKASPLRAAAALHRSTGSVHAQARNLGTPFPPKFAYRKKLKNSTDGP